MKTTKIRRPPGPTEPYSSDKELFQWMNDNYAIYGDIYKASVYGKDTYVISSPEYLERILRWNW